MKVNTITPFIDVRASRGLVKDVYPVSNDSVVREPLANYDLLLDMYRNDEVIATALNTTVDMVSRNGYDFVVKESDDKDVKKPSSNISIKKAIQKFKDLKFNEVLDKWTYSHLLYGDTFIELKRETPNSEITELHVLETTEIKIEYDSKGNVTGYWQRPKSLNSKLISEHFDKKDKDKEDSVFFTPDEIIHSKAISIGSQVYSYTPLEPAARAFANKMKADTYLREIFDHLPPARKWHLKGANREQKESFKNDLIKIHSRTSQDMITYGDKDSDTTVEEIIPEFDKGLTVLREQLREQVLMVTRVPPVWVGIVNNDGANRGNSEAQIFSYETRIKKIQQQQQDKINQELMVKLGFNDIEYNFNPISMKDEKVIIENLAVLASLTVENHRISKKGLLRYLARNGITDFRDEDFVEVLPEESLSSFGNQAASNAMSPSRKGMDKKNDAMTNTRDKTGVSAAGKAKMDENAMKMRSSQYWTYDIDTD